MEREKLIRDDFPPAVGGDGFDRESVIAHLAAVAAGIAALESRIAALEVERDAFRRQASAGGTGEPQTGSHPIPFTPTGPPAPGVRVDVLSGDGERAAASFGEVTRRRPEPDSAAPTPAAGGSPSQAEGSRNDEVAARLAASALALEGADRETIRRKLDSDYDLSDPEGLVDDVLARLA